MKHILTDALKLNIPGRGTVLYIEFEKNNISFDDINKNDTAEFESIEYEIRYQELRGNPPYKEAGLVVTKK